MIELLFWAIVGFLSGVGIGIIPGAGPFIATAMVYPFLTSVDPASIMMFYVALLITNNYTNSVTAILYGIPGDAAAIPTAKDGYRFFRKGYGSLAVSSNAIGSSIGVIFSVLLFLLLLPQIMQVFKFYNSIVQVIIIGITIILITFLNKQNKIITLSLFLFGGFLAHIGVDPVTFESFATFGNQYLSLGIPFSAVMIALYIFPELLKIQKTPIEKPKNIIKYAIGKNITIPALLGSVIGFFSGLIPGITNILGSYLSSVIVKKIFCKPVLKSIVAAEAANNSGALSSLLPLLVLAIPITGSEVLIYYLMIENGFVFNASNTIAQLQNVLLLIPLITFVCFILSWYGFNLLGKIAYFYKKYQKQANIFILTTISIVSILTFPIKEWVIICLSVFMVLGYTLKNFDTSPIIYGFFLSDLFYESLIRTIVILS